MNDTSILVLNGPNLNLLGKREPKVYGHDSLDSINRMLLKHGETRGTKIVFKQTNLEGELVSFIQEGSNEFSAIVLNPGGYSHTSVAIHDAIEACSIPVIECHLSNIHNREEFRRHSITAAKCAGVVAGFGALSYRLALDAALHIVKNPHNL